MANQYAESFQHYIEEKYNTPIKQVLNHFKHMEYDFEQIANMTGYKASTVRKWCARLEIDIKPYPGQSGKHSTSLLDIIQQPHINTQNALYKQWI